MGIKLASTTLLLVLGLSVMNSPVQAAAGQQVSAKFDVTASINNGCRFTGSNKLSVDLPDLLIGQRSVSRQIYFNLQCTPGANATIGIDAGQHPLSGGSRALALDGKNGQLIPYQIFAVKEGKKIDWKNPIMFTPDELNKQIEVDVEIKDPPSPLIPGHYTDTATINVSY
ncbi:Csu type fimbrial protein [Serratia aquatilis]|uniref:Spore coat U domain-containing protein n=1 Tax=Serratia aquatilis TaxID=1737515 RepID=A0ABV6EH69_9GAMM